MKHVVHVLIPILLIQASCFFSKDLYQTPSPSPEEDTGTPESVVPTVAPDADEDGSPDGEDCDNEDPFTFCERPTYYAPEKGDCDDTNPSINPSATEQCDGVDDDCDTLIDEGVMPTFYQDWDGDTCGTSSVSTQACEAPQGFVADSHDCDDKDASVHPGTLETVDDGTDQDCDGQELCFADEDNDGYRPNATSTVASSDGDCNDPLEASRTDPTTDCDDTDLAIIPGSVATHQGVEMVCIPNGTFTMGSPSTEVGRQEDETQHTVTLSRNFWVGKSEVTQAQFQIRMGYNPSYFSSCGGTCPVENVTWYEAAAFANALSTAAGQEQCYDCTGSGASVSCTENTAYATLYECPGYRLLTESEWEYAARAGETAAFQNGANLESGDSDGDGTNDVDDCSGNLELYNGTRLDDIAWYCGSSLGTIHPVGGLEPNNWGLVDVSGNVREWCSDWQGSYPTEATVDPTGVSSGSTRVGRSGFYGSVPCGVRLADRDNTPPGNRQPDFGFRIARSGF